MSTKLVLAMLLLLFSLPGHTALIQISGSGEHYYGQDPANPTFRFSAIYDTATPGVAESTARVNYSNALTNFVVWSSVASTQFNPTNPKFDFQSGIIWVVNNEPGFHNSVDSFGLASDVVNLNGIDNLRGGIFLATANLDAVASTQIPLTLDLSDFDTALFFLSTPSTTMPNTFEAFQAGNIRALTFTPIASASVPDPGSLGLFSTVCLLMIVRKRARFFGSAEAR